jgi:hypothetical protein
MKKLLILFILCFSALAAHAPEYRVQYIEPGVKIDPYKSIFYAVAMVESSMNPNAYNRAENAVGIVQIREIRIRDYNKRANKNYKLTDCYDPEISRIVFMYYAREIGWRNQEKLIRCWNGGPQGMKIKQTKIYYNKVLLTLKKYY